MKIYTIIVIYNGMRNDWITKCFTSLIGSTIENKIIAIDNNSKDESVKFIEDNFPSVILIESVKNLGFGKANNIGIRKALELDADYFFLFNQDAWVEPDTIEKLVRVAENNKQYGILSPMHLVPNSNSLDESFSKYIRKYETSKKIIEDFLFDKLDEIYNIEMVNAAAWLITKKCIEQVGGFDPLFFYRGEDDDYASRVIYHNFKIGVVLNSVMYHDRGERNNQSFKSINLALFASYIFQIKNVKEKLLYNIYFFIEYFFTRSMRQFLQLNFKSVMLQIFTFFKVIFLIPRIIYSRQLSKDRKGVFL